jgi:type I restriction enzyme S subunit
MEWKTVKLGEVGEIVGGATPLTKNPVYYDGEISWITPKDLANYSDRYISRGERNITEEGYKSCSCKMLPKGSVLFSSRAPIGYIAIAENDLCTNQGFKSIIPNADKVDNVFLFYLLKQYKDYIAGLGSGTTFMEVSGSVMKNIELPLPPIDTQRRIAAILSSLDDKIENNNRINRNLEAQAQALFKSWFVDFEPFGGIMPDDWKETTIGEMCTCYLGGTPSRAKSEYWNGDIPWINSGEVNKYRIVEGSEYITELGLKKSATKLLPKKTTVLAITGATLGQVSLLEIEACANQSVIGILENEKMPYEFIYPLIVNDIDKIILNQTGGAQQHINKDNVESHNIIIPTDEIMAKYKAIQAPLFETIANNCHESQRLATLRDSLLPKLMKGEITL